jgi:hypothetical protein
VRRFALILVLMLVPAPAAHALDGAITVTGTEGREIVTVEAMGSVGDFQADKYPNAGYLITPALTVVGPSDAAGPRCRPVNEPVTARPVGVFCQVQGRERVTSFVVNLGGGNDDLALDTGGGAVDALAVDGGAGDDVLAVESTAPTIKGGDGDDTLIAPRHEALVTATTPAPVTFDGGAGRDLVDYGKLPGGVSADLTSGRASAHFPQPVPRPDHLRSDTLTGIERLSGSRFGDSLLGSSGADELIGNGGGDVLDGRDGTDTVTGGPGSDRVVGGAGADVVDGGDGVDEYPLAPGGGDTYNSRDGSIERLVCQLGDAMTVDLVDQVEDTSKCKTLSAAAAKHHFDTKIVRRLAVRGRVAVARLRCPLKKTERCRGILRLRAGGRQLAVARYRIPRGGRLRLRLGLSAREIARVRGHVITLEADEVDGDGRPRRVVQRFKAG